MSSEKENINQQIESLLTFNTPNNESDLFPTHPVNLTHDIDFSFIFFSDANQQPQNKYQLVFDLAEFADNHGFKAVWMPERHFHPFGGIYPNPSLLAAALAVKTNNIRLRSGSVVLPLHHPAHVVESWAMVDNLSNGRVDLGFASGWNPNDFIANPADFEQRKTLWHERIPMVEKLWRGEALTCVNGQGKEIPVQVYPKPIQTDLNIWLVVTKSDESFEHAGKHGYNILTMLQGIDLEELGRKIQLYRQARAKHGFDPAAGKVTLMLHTLVHDNLELVEDAVREPFTHYIKSALSGHIEGMKEKPTEQEINKIVGYSYQRYFTTGALFGSIEQAKNVVRKAYSVGVNEIACLMDFGVDYDLVKESLPYLNTLKNEITEELINQSLTESTAPSSRDISDEVAIIGLHGFLPQSMDIEAFWHHVDNDLSAISEIPPSRFNWIDYFDETGEDNHKMRSKWGGFIPEIAHFDPAFFGLLPQDADLIDPQQRLLLLSVYKTIEDAGYRLNDLKGSRTGVFIAIEDNEYLTYLRKAGIDLGINGFNHHPSMAANRISYFFDLRGPSEIVNTMCSSAAVAIHNAVNAIKRGEIDQAIVGGARILLDPEAFIGLSRLKVISTKNTVKSFGEEADGYLRSEGVASILIKPLATAKRDTNSIYALIKNSAVNYNGQGGMSMAAPNRESHIDVIKSCYTKANIDIRDIAYIEAQGMGNQVSDIIEWEACNSALEQLAAEQNLPYEPGYCAVSTLKPLIGHMECVSALGALFKIIRSFQTNTLHKIAHLEQVNPYLNTTNRPCYLLTETKSWPARQKPRLAALHSYGSGGNNAHLLIEEYPAQQQSLNPSKQQPPHEFKLMRCWIDTQKSHSKPFLPAKTVKQICVIGAGPAGLVMAKSLLEEGHQPVIFEKQSTLGGLWVLNQEKTAGAYKKTRFQSSKFTSVFSDFYLEDIKSNFYSVEEVKHYLDSYANHFNLNAHIQYQSEVIAVEEKGEQWLVKVQHNQQISTYTFDGVALCQGSFWQPYQPNFKGLSEFKGQLLHSGQYYDNTLFKDKRVLIVGNGVSAMDIAEEAAAVAAKVLWSRRSVKLILPRMVGFVPNDCQSPARLMIDSNRVNIIERLKISMPDYYQTYVKSGLLPSSEEFNNNPIVHINDGIIQLVADGKILARKQIAYFNERGCVFEGSNDVEEVDIVVFCTGYKNTDQEDARFNFIKDIAIPRDFSMGIFYHKNTSLVNTSVLPIAYTGSFYFLEMVARWYAQILSNRLLLTEEEKNHRITPNHYLIMAPISAVLFGLRLGLFPKPEDDFKTFWRFLNYPAFPMIQRLQGFHKHDQAEALLKQFVQKSYVKTDDQDPDLKELKYRILAGLEPSQLDELNKKGEITHDEWLKTRQFRNNPYVLTWETQYIKRPTPTRIESNHLHSLFAVTMKKILATILRIPDSEVDELKNLSAYGFDSISLTSFAREISLKFPFIVLQPTLFLEYSCLQDLIGFLYQNYELDIKKQLSSLVVQDNAGIKAARLYPELMILQKTKQQHAPMFWFHAALGTVQMYLPLVNHLDKAIPVYAIQAKGIATDDKPYDDLIKMANYYTEILLSINQGHVFHLGGYSQGGVIAYEVARQLQLRGEQVANLVMIDAPFPPVISFLSENHHYLLTLLNLLQMQQLASLNDIHDYLTEECLEDNYLDFLVELGLKKGLTFAKGQIKNLLQTYYQVSMANLHSMHGYSATPLPLPGQIHCHYFQRHKAKQFFSREVSSITEFSLQNAYYQQSNCVQRWQILLPHFTLYQTKAADHFSFFEDPQTLNKMAEVCQAIYSPIFKKEQA